MKTRSTRDGPFCWQNKAARRAIRDAFDDTNNVASALGVYAALTEIASDEQAESFKVAHATLQSRSGVSVSTIKKVLRGLSKLGLVHISTPKYLSLSTYTLLPLVNGCLTPLANVAQNEPLATSEESSEEPIEESSEQSPAGRGDESEPLQLVADSPEQPAITAEEVYAAYPKKTAKEYALKAIKKALKKNSADKLLTATTAYAAATALWAERDKKFIPNPATWFNGGSFDDDPAMWKRGGHAALDPKLNLF
jgi:hypothetical protein